MINIETYKNRFRELVDSTNLPKTECAKQIGISYSTLNKLYNHGKSVRAHVIFQIAEYFNVSIDYILGQSDDKQIKSHRR